MTRTRYLPLGLFCLLAAGGSAQAAHAQSCAAPSFSLAPKSASGPNATENVGVGGSRVTISGQGNGYARGGR